MKVFRWLAKRLQKGVQRPFKGICKAFKGLNGLSRPQKLFKGIQTLFRRKAAKNPLTSPARTMCLFQEGNLSSIGFIAPSKSYSLREPPPIQKAKQMQGPYKDLEGLLKALKKALGTHSKRN